MAVDHFRGSPEHQKDGAHALAAIAQAGTTFPAFIANLQRAGVALPEISATLAA